MAEEDDFAAQLASMDRAQLQALMTELSDREGNRFAFTDPRANMRAPGGGTDSGEAFARHYTDSEDLMAHVTSLGGKTLYSAYDAYKHMGSRSEAKKKKAAYEKALRDEAARQQKIRAERLKAVTNQLRTVDLRDKVNLQFRDLNLEGLHKRVAQQGLDTKLGGITEQYDDLTRRGGFATAGSGLAGSSFDAERLADTQAAQMQDRASAAAQANMQFQQLNQSSDDRRRQLLSSISGGNPGEEARLSGEMANVQNTANNVTNQAGWQQQGQYNDQTAMNNQSQALGGLLSTYSRLYTQNQTPR
jgi:hypothetical protein